MDSFAPTRALLNPKFEGYRLDAIPQEEVTRFPLPYKPSQAAISGKSSFFFQEVQSRITHNHLAVWDEDGRAAYVDGEYRVILILVDSGTKRPSFYILYELPRPIQSSATYAPNREYPSAIFLTSTLLFVSDGHGTLYPLQIENGVQGRLLGMFRPPSNADVPFKIHSAHRITPLVAVAILSSRVYEKTSDADSPANRKINQIHFDLCAVKLELLSLRSDQQEIRPLNVLWQRRGDDVPIYTAHEETLKMYLLIGGSPYHPIGQLAPPSYEPAADELAPIPRKDENLDAQVTEPAKPPPYSWTQTQDTVTVAIALPSITPKSKINVSFSPQALTVHIDSEVPTSLPIPRYSAKRLWDTIFPSTSYWTWDREAEHSFGILSIYLDKQHDGTRWSHVFALAGQLASAESSEQDVEVPETLDPSELWHIREALEKYTAALTSGEDASGLGLGRGVPSLAEGEMDVEVDESVGRQAYATWVGEDGSVPPWWTSTRDTPFQLLATPLPGTHPPTTTIVVKNSLDGTVHSVVPSIVNPNSGPDWLHTSTFSALAFVLASKQDTRFTYHISSKTVLAFEGGVRDRGGNVYIYRAASARDNWAKQAILKVDDGFGGSLMGVGAIMGGEGLLVLCLTEGELVLLDLPL